MGILEGKVAIVTGASAGIGKAIALELVRHGAQVVAAGRDRDRLEGALEGAGPAVVPFVADVTDAGQVDALVAATLVRHGKIDALVNNAGVLRPGSALESSLEDYDLQMDVNVRGPFLACRAVLPSMVEAGSGSIVNIGSINSLVAESKLVAYTASKGAVMMMTKAIALDHAADGIRANCICPGFVDTALNVPHYELLGGRQALEEGLPSFQPIGRAIEPEEIAGGVVFLVSDLSTAVTGTAIPVDGGVTAKA